MVRKEIKFVSFFIIFVCSLSAIAQIKITERDVLKKILLLNPNNKLNWDLSEPNLNRLDGVSIYGNWGDGRDGRIKNLILQNDGITVLPKEIKHLKYLNFLGLSNNSLKVLPEEVGKLKNLETLYLEDNELTSLPNSLKNLEKLYRVNLSKNKFTEIPKVLFELKDRRFSDLDMAKNLISVIPKSIKKIQRFDEIDLSYNKFVSVPKVLFELPNIKRLNMENNQITTIPKDIKKLTKLTSLNLSSNKITNFPKEITILEKLEYVDLHSNVIEVLPEEIYKLTKLRSLYLYSNRLKRIPEGVSKLSNLEYLDISHNEITILPTSISSLNKLSEFNFYGNHIIYVSTDICDMEYKSNIEEFGKDEESLKCTDDPSIYGSYQGIVKKEILDLFNAYKPTIEEAENTTVETVKVIVGDLDDDDVPDGLLYFTLNNTNKSSKAAVYNTYEGSVSVIGGFEPDFNFDIVKIEDSIVYLSISGKIKKYVVSEDNSLTELSD